VELFLELDWFTLKFKRSIISGQSIILCNSLYKNLQFKIINLLFRGIILKRLQTVSYPE